MFIAAQRKHGVSGIDIKGQRARLGGLTRNPSYQSSLQAIPGRASHCAGLTSSARAPMNPSFATPVLAEPQTVRTKSKS